MDQHKEEKHECCGESKHGAVCDCSHHKVIPILIVIVAALFLLKALGILSSGLVDILWPIALGVGGVTKLKENKCKCC